jgi:hypothetical protein
VEKYMMEGVGVYCPVQGVLVDEYTTLYDKWHVEQLLTYWNALNSSILLMDTIMISNGVGRTF